MIAERTSETIAAVGTATGTAALAVVRLSGPDALAIGARVFRGRTDLGRAAGFTVHHGFLVDESGGEVDEVLATVFRAPRSYSGEDMVEFGCHGGLLVTRLVLEALLGAGARLAEPGEFTRRAFLHGRIDLSQAEAVADVIAAGSRRGQRASLEQVAGRLGARVREVRAQVLDLCALLEIDLDFAEEGLEIIAPKEAARRISLLRTEIMNLANSYAHGRLCREGVSVVLAGEPNAGKSSLFNALLRQERAIVTPVPGTTRDALEESIAIDGLAFRLTDTAGLRETADEVERHGVERSLAAVRYADIILRVLDAGVSASIADHVGAFPDASRDQHVIYVLNKCDLLPSWPAPARTTGAQPANTPDVAVSALTGKGLEDLRTALAHEIEGDLLLGENAVCVTNLRHKEALSRAGVALDTALESLASGTSLEYVAFDVRETAHALAEITGEVTSEEILHHIFSQFCIGK